jgi:hypothetical protein
MQERAALVGATLAIESSIGRGTTLILRMGSALPVGTSDAATEGVKSRDDDHV